MVKTTKYIKPPEEIIAALRTNDVKKWDGWKKKVEQENPEAVIDLREEPLRGAYTSGADMNGMVISGEKDKLRDIIGIKMLGTLLSNAEAKYCKINGSNLAGIIANEANFEGSDFSEAIIADGELKNSNLRNTTWMNAKVRGVDFTGADMTGADLSLIKLDKPTSSSKGMPMLKDVKLDKETYDRASNSFKALWEKNNSGKAEELGFKSAGRDIANG